MTPHDSGSTGVRTWWTLGLPGFADLLHATTIRAFIFQCRCLGPQEMVTSSQSSNSVILYVIQLLCLTGNLGSS